MYEFDKQGANIVISARRSDELERVKKGCLHKDKIFILPLDLAERKTFKEKTETVIKQFGKIDLIVHNAGISQRSYAKDTKIEVDQKLMEVNYLGTVALTKEILPYFIKQHSGHYAVITSLVGKFGSPMRSGYAASKHALHGFFDSLRAEVYRDNIKVTLICPGFIHTNVSVNALTGDGSAQHTMDKSTAAGLSPNECAQQIVKALEREKEEVLIGKKEVFGVYVKRFFPTLFSRILQTAKVT